MFLASLCPSSGEQEQDWLKFHVKIPGCAGCGRGVGSVQSNNSFQKVHRTTHKTNKRMLPHSHEYHMKILSDFNKVQVTP
jgi:ribosomal protein L34E